MTWSGIFRISGTYDILVIETHKQANKQKAVEVGSEKKY